MTEYRIPDHQRMILFDGELLASSSNADGKSHRWSVASIYRTTDGRYVLSTVGRSGLYHSTYSDCMPPTAVTASLAFLDVEIAIACPRCTPPPFLPGDFIKVIPEVDRGTAEVCEDAAALVVACHRTSPDGVRYMPRFVRRALSDAGEVDAAVHDAYMLERV